MSKTKKYLTLLALAVSGGSIYLIPYIKYVFYDPQIAAMHINNEQSGVLLTLYAIGCMVLYIPKGANSIVVIILSLLPGAISLMMYGIMFSIIGECKIPVYVTGTAIGIASIVGYALDLFFSAMFGRWLDKFNNTGYVYIFMFLAGLGVLGFILSYLIRRKAKNIPQVDITER